MRAALAVVSSVLFVSAVLSAQQTPEGVEPFTTLYAGTSSGGDGGLFGTLDTTTAHFKELGDPTENGPLPGLACNSLGEFFGANNATGGGADGSTLLTIDPATGGLLATIGVITDDADDLPLGMTDISFQPGTDVLYGISDAPRKDGFLYTIDVQTAIATLVGETGLIRGGLGFRDDGTLWLATSGIPEVLAQLDPTDGSVIDSVPIEIAMDSLAFRPSDDVLFAHDDEVNGVYTIDTTDGTVTFVADDDSPGEVTSLAFGPAPPNVPVVSYFLPKSVVLKLNSKKPEKSRLVSSGFFDLGPDEVDLSLGATIDVGGYELVAPSLVPNKKGTVFKLKQAGLLFTVKPQKSGSSRALFTLKVQDDLAGLIDPAAALLLHFTSPEVDAEGEVMLEQGKYKLGKKRGALISPTIYLFKVNGKLKGGGLDGLLLKAGFATDGTTPDIAPDLQLDFGAGFSSLVPSASFVKKGDRFLFKGSSGGVTSVVLDYLRETASIKVKGVDLGVFPEGPQPVTVTLGLGGDVRTVSVRMVRKGKALKY